MGTVLGCGCERHAGEHCEEEQSKVQTEIQTSGIILILIHIFHIVIVRIRLLVVIRRLLDLVIIVVFVEGRE
jgi:hypothetical protein